jgi:lipopolysaccharide/colanic/teichoic acid biosynthesis glycosyltransferase
VPDFGVDVVLIGNTAREKTPSSRARLFSHVAPFDLIWATASPVLAFLIRDGAIKSLDDVVLYAGVALVISVIVFQAFRISASLPGFFSIHDAITVGKAAGVTVALCAACLFVFTRLDYAPRSVPIIHFLLLLCGLIGVRAWKRLTVKPRAARAEAPGDAELDSVIVIGATRLAWLYSQMLEELSAPSRRIVAIVDERPQFAHRTLDGHPILGGPDELARIIDEYATHGVSISKVVMAVHPRHLTAETRRKLRALCEDRAISIEDLHDTFALLPASPGESENPLLGVVDPDGAAALARPYWKIKRAIDVVVALAAMMVFAPLALMVTGLVLIDVGVPIVFWQQRIGHLGRPVRVYKFRTMRSTFDRAGKPIPEAERLSALGRLLRANHLDEFPQLFNILTGSMSLVGPRPLLPVDQPSNVRFRLNVRPGLTGLAQISGGTLLSEEEKGAIDDWYVQHASLFVDLKIIVRTLLVVLRGNPRDDTQISAALAERCLEPQGAFVRVAPNDSC